MDTTNPIPDGVGPPPRPAVDSVGNVGASPQGSPPKDISSEASKTVAEPAKPNSDGHGDQSPEHHTAADDDVANIGKASGVTNDKSNNDFDRGTYRLSEDNSDSDSSGLEAGEAGILLNAFIENLCCYLLGKPREEWTDYLDCILDPHENSMFSYRSYLEPRTLRLMHDVCNGVADLRRGGSGYFKPELYRPPGPAPLICYPVPNVMDRADDPHERGPDPYDEGPDAHYEGHAPAGFTAIGRYHYNKQIWNYCDDLLNLSPDKWMDNLPGVVELIFDPRKRSNASRVDFQPETILLLQTMQDAFDGVPPPCVPARMSLSRDCFEIVPSPENFDIRHEIDWVPRMTRQEMLASIPDRALHIRMYGRPKPDRRLEKKHRDCMVTSRGARDDTVNYLITEKVKDNWDDDFTPEQLESLQGALDRLMKVRAEAVRDHDAIDRARAQYRNTLASVNKNFSHYVEGPMDLTVIPNVDQVAEETLVALEDAAKTVERSRKKVREVMGCKCGMPQSDNEQSSTGNGLHLEFLMGMLICTFIFVFVYFTRIDSHGLLPAGDSEGVKQEL